MLGRSLIGFAVIAALVSPGAFAQDEHADQIRKLLDDAMRLYSQGKYVEAYGKFEQAFQKNPSSDLVYAFMQRAGQDAVASMMNSADENIRGIGYRLFEKSKPGVAERRGKKAILAYLESLQSEDHAVYRNAHWHLRNIGPWAVRFLVPHLANTLENTLRGRIQLVLTQMGTDATLALAEALKADNDPGRVLLKQNACAILGNIRDERAIPALKRTLEDPNQPPEVKKFAHEALAKITHKSANEWRKATDYYFDLAEKYYYAHPDVILAWNRSNLIWRWDTEGQKLLEREAPRFAFNEQLAEDALYDLIDLDPNYVHGPTRASAWSLLACVHFAQGLEAEAGLFAADQAAKTGAPGVLPDHVENLKKLVARYDRNQVSGRLPGRAYLYEALARCMKDGNALVAKAALEAIREMGRADDLPPAGESGDGSNAMGYALIEALTNADKRVRYAAAEALVRINPRTQKLGMELVIPNLVDAVGEQGVRVALVIYDVQDDNDRNFVNGLRKLLSSINMFPVVATSGAEGVIMAKQFPTEDVIIVQKKLAGHVYFRETDTKKGVIDTVFDTLRDDVRTKNIPRILLCDDEAQFTEAKQQFDQSAQGFIKKDVHKLDLQKMMEDLFSSEQAQKDAKDRADHIARSAAESLASIDPANTLLPYRDSVDALIKTIAIEPLRHESVRVAACKALGRFGDQRALSALSKALAERAEDAEKAAGQKPVRTAAARAMSEIFKATDVEVTADVYDVLKRALVDGDLEIESLCAEALGNARLQPEQRREVAKIRRINDKSEHRPTRSADDE